MGSLNKFEIVPFPNPNAMLTSLVSYPWLLIWWTLFPFPIFRVQMNNVLFESYHLQCSKLSFLSFLFLPFSPFSLFPFCSFPIAALPLLPFFLLFFCSPPLFLSLLYFSYFLSVSFSFFLYFPSGFFLPVLHHCVSFIFNIDFTRSLLLLITATSFVSLPSLVLSLFP